MITKILLFDAEATRILVAVENVVHRPLLPQVEIEEAAVLSRIMGLRRLSYNRGTSLITDMKEKWTSYPRFIYRLVCLHATSTSQHGRACGMQHRL